MKIPLIIIVLIQMLALTLNSAHARDPYHVIPDYGYDGEPTVSGGDGWTFGDYWVVGGVALMVAAVITLPRIFDGKCIEKCTISPLSIGKFQRFTRNNASNYGVFNNIERHRIIYKFPTRKV